MPENQGFVDDPVRLRRALVQHLESLQRAGVRQLPKINWEVAREPIPATRPAIQGRSLPPPIADVGTTAPQPRPVQPPKTNVILPTPTRLPSVWSSEAHSTPERLAALSVLRDEICNCRACPALVSNRTQTVFGVGNPHPRLCFFGEAPGADEDRSGIPFVGRAGQLLDKIIEACTLKREDVYILNTLKCRPPDNRAPTEDEVENCRDFFERQFAVLRPEFICCLGATAARALLRSNLALGRLRRQFHNYQGAKVIVTYHPAYLLRNAAAKKDTWEDMKLLLQEMGIPLPGKESSDG